MLSDNDASTPDGATLKCKCKDAEKFQKRHNNLERLSHRLESFKKFCLGYNVTVSDNFIDTLKYIGTRVVDKDNGKCSIEYAGKIKVSFAMSKDELILSYQYQVKQTIEV